MSTEITFAILDAWIESEYPFDPATCGLSVGGHLYYGKIHPNHGCENVLHMPLVAELRRIPWREEMRVSEWLRDNLETLLFLRGKYCEFWPQKKP